MVSGNGFNYEIYNDIRVIRTYLTRADRLQPPEKAILEELRPVLGQMEMLDIGIGVGRTTRFFAPLARRYTGVDYAPNMVRQCQERFPGLDLQVADARDLRQFGDAVFDLVLFSYNGLDCLDPADRRLALNAIGRVLKPGGRFVYSFHNLNAIGLLYSMEWSWHPVRFLENAKVWLDVRRKNRPVPPEAQFAMIHDGPGGFRAAHCYTRPDYEIQQARQLGFASVRAFRPANGDEFADLGQCETSGDLWIYLLCTL
jgi:SAM-dependent methyltransferase